MTAQLIVYCPEHLQAVRNFPDRTDQRLQFEQKFNDLSWATRLVWLIH